MSTADDQTYYSGTVGGDPAGNQGCAYDITNDGYLGIIQTKEAGLPARVLLSPKQVGALMAFVKKRTLKE